MSLVNTIRTQFPDYLSRAESAFNREHNLWEKPMYQDNAVFRAVKQQYGIGPNKVVTRRQIIKLFSEEKYYDGYLCAMTWGKIGTFQNGRAHFEDAFAISKEDVEAKIKRLIALIKEGKIGDAFTSMCAGGENTIPGLGVSFFTKVLYFAGASVSCPVLPLILDTKTLSIVNTLYKEAGIKKTVRQSKPHYIYFCKEMKRISEELELPTAGHLEAFLFNDGFDLLNKL